MPQVSEKESMEIQSRIEKAANERQVGGNHYRDVNYQQHWDRAWDLYREAWFVLNITKYCERYRKKDGIKDLEKARHYLDKLIEKETEAANKEGMSDPGQIVKVRENTYVWESTPETRKPLGKQYWEMTPEELRSINPSFSAEAVRLNLGHWKCIDPVTNRIWRRDDGMCVQPFLLSKADNPDGTWSGGLAMCDQKYPMRLQCHFCTSTTSQLRNTIKGPMCDECYSGHVSSGVFKQYESGKE